MKVVLDSTVIFSIFYEKDRFHQLAMKIFDQFMDGKLEVFIPTIVMPEVCGAMKRETGDHKISMIVQSQLEGWIENNILSVKELTVERMIYATENAISFGLKGADAVFVALARELGVPLATFDDGMKKRVMGKIKLFETEE